MPRYCDVALPVPVDCLFTYAVGETTPVLGGRVLVPFRREQLQGIAVRLYEATTQENLKTVLRAVDSEPVLSGEQLRLGEWIAEYYLAPLGEVLRSMLPLQAEIRQRTIYRITELGKHILDAPIQSSLSTEPEESSVEQAVLSYLASGSPAAATKVAGKTAAKSETLSRMLQKRWITRESVADTRSVTRTVRMAVLVEGVRLPKLNNNQQLLLAELAGAQGVLTIGELSQLPVPKTTLSTLVRRGLVRIDEVAAASPFAGSAALFATSTVPLKLNTIQADTALQIAASVQMGKYQSFLLHGVTGSGKTAVYLSAMQRALDAGKCSLLLVPEIGLTPAMVAQLQAAFGDRVALLHSALSSVERVEQWHRIRRGEAPVVVGTRSAVFAPLQNLGLLIVDEEHDASYKQAELPRYHARDVAVMRAKLLHATIVLGSATPSLESWANAERGKYTLLSMSERVANRPLPAISLIDMRQEFNETGQEQLLSRALITEIEATLERREQVMLLLNRRGYSFVVMCRACGEKLECENCAIAMTHHKHGDRLDAHAQAGQRLECHYCGFRRTVPQRCPKCDSEHLYFFGVGSQQGEERLQEMFPQARIGRMDRDTMRTHRDFERMLTRLHSGDINLLVGTQMIAKGHDMHGVTLVGVLGADHSLSMPDFRSAERVFQLVTQVAGRAGRGERTGRVLIQTYHPDHYAIRFAAEHNYEKFVEHEQRYRRLLHYPPATVLTNILLEHAELGKVSNWAGQLGRWLQQHPHPNVRILGPAAAPIARLKRIHRFHLILKASNRKELALLVRQMLDYADKINIPRRNLTVDVDAVHLM
ncbi:MAG TPA: primosomal protein N' [Acidobacteriaceae bacterium]|jgi:primosomal protein N' (replication factor Y)|nr:primosomal protein N' [Acidobacteriaceae bacterium]